MIRCFPFAVLIMLSACSSEPDYASPLADTHADAVVLIVADAPPNLTLRRSADGPYARAESKHEISYFDDDGIARSPEFAYGTTDTLTIPTRRDRFAFSHAIRGVETWHYLAQSGDTIRLTYDGAEPRAQVVNRDAPNLNVDALTRSLAPGDSLPALVQLSAIMLVLSGTPIADLLRVHPMTERRLAALASDQLGARRTGIDSLLAAGLIDAESAAFHRSNVEYERASLAMRKGEGVDAALFASPPPDAIYAGPFRSALRQYVVQAFDLPRVAVANGSVPDFRQAFRRATSSDLLSDGARDIVLFDAAEQMMQHGSVDERQDYFRRLRATVRTPGLADYLAQTYSLDTGTSTELAMERHDGTTVLLGDVLAGLRGRVVYVDVWASWCAPCRAAMPASRALQDELAGEPVAFVYVSFDDERSDWQTASADERLAALPHSYRAINRYASRMVDDLSLHTLPRYLIYGKDGALVHPNAPSPADARPVLRSALNR